MKCVFDVIFIYNSRTIYYKIDTAKFLQCVTKCLLQVSFASHIDFIIDHWIVWPFWTKIGQKRIFIDNIKNGYFLWKENESYGKLDKYNKN